MRWRSKTGRYEENFTLSETLRVSIGVGGGQDHGFLNIGPHGVLRLAKGGREGLEQRGLEGLLEGIEGPLHVLLLPLSALRVQGLAKLQQRGREGPVRVGEDQLLGRFRELLEGDRLERVGNLNEGRARVLRGLLLREEPIRQVLEGG